MKKLKGSNLKIKKGIKAILILGVGACLSTVILGCGSKDLKVMDTISISDTLEKTEDETYVDDVLSMQKSESEEFTDLENIEQLENSVRRYHILENVEFSEYGYRQYSDEELEKLKNYTPEDVEEMLSLLKTDSLNENERVEMLQLMYWMKQQDKDTIDTDGLITVENALLQTMKAVTCDATGMNPEDYNKVTINERPTNIGENIRLTVETDDDDIIYNVGYNTLYQHLIDNIYDIQNASSAPSETEEDFNNKLNLIETGINYIKKSCFAGAKVEEHSIFGFFKEDYLGTQTSESSAENKIKIK